MGNRLTGRVAIVTGAGRGIGRGVAKLLAEEGASVVVNDLGGSVDGSESSATPADLVVGEIKEDGGRAVATYDSVSEFGSAARIVRTAIEEFGRLDILVNAAGILRDRMIFNMSEEEWDSVVSVHLYGSFNMVRHSVPHMIDQRAWTHRPVLVDLRSGLARTDQLLRRQGGHRRTGPLSRQRAPTARDNGERRVSGWTHPHGRVDTRKRGRVAARAGGQATRQLPGRRPRGLSRAGRSAGPRKQCPQDRLPLYRCRRRHHRPSDRHAWLGYFALFAATANKDHPQRRRLDTRRAGTSPNVPISLATGLVNPSPTR